MALSSETYTGNGSNRDFVVPFPYISRDHVSVSVNGTGVSFVWITAGQVRTDVAPANGATVKVQRTTPTTPLTDFADGDGNYEAALDIAALQPLYVVQEVQDFVTDAALGGAAAVASSISFAPAGSLASTNVQAAILEAMTDLRAELAPLANPELTGAVVSRGTLYRGPGTILPTDAPFQVDHANPAGQARFRHSTGLGLLINQGAASGGVGITNQDNAALQLGANNTPWVDIAPGGAVNLLLGSGALRVGGHITRSVVSAASRINATAFTSLLSHGGSRVPDIMAAVLVCEVADLGYAVGDEVPITSVQTSTGSGNSATFQSATQVGYQQAFGFPIIPLKNASTAAIITTNCWRVVFRCIWL